MDEDKPETPEYRILLPPPPSAWRRFLDWWYVLVRILREGKR